MRTLRCSPATRWPWSLPSRGPCCTRAGRGLVAWVLTWWGHLTLLLLLLLVVMLSAVAVMAVAALLHLLPLLLLLLLRLLLP